MGRGFVIMHGAPLCWASLAAVILAVAGLFNLECQLRVVGTAVLLRGAVAQVCANIGCGGEGPVWSIGGKLR